MGRAPRNKEARVCKKQMPASPLQSSREKEPLGWGCRGEPAVPQGPGTLQRDPKRQVIDEGAPPVFIGDIQGMNRVLLSPSLLQIPEWRIEGLGKTENACEQQRCHVIAEPPGRTGLPPGPEVLGGCLCLLLSPSCI